MAPSVKNVKNNYEVIEKVSEMPPDEFHCQIQDWMATQQPKLQSQLRKDLIENFTKTGLGRQITSTMQNRQGIVLSPLTLVLNTLVSEFLHSQDYHFTLCVFATEVVFPHTLPDFSKENFAFSDKELDEIFEAMGLVNLDAIDEHIGSSYYKISHEKGQRSLLYVVIKSLIDHLKHIKDEKLNKQVQAPTTSEDPKPPTASQNPHPPGPKKPPRYNRCSSPSENPSEPQINVTNLKTLNKTIEKLSKSVKNMARHYMTMETSRMNNKSQSQHTSKLEMDRDEKHYYNLMRHIETISQKLDKCVVNFENLEEKLSSQKSGIDELFEKMRYREWFARMTTSKNGQKYIDKFQRAIERYWHAEKEKLRKHYQEKFDQEKKALKQKYKEELRAQIEQKLGAQTTAVNENRDAIQEILEDKMQKIEVRDTELGKKLEQLEEIVHEYKGDEQKKREEIRKMAQKLTETLKTVEKTVQQVPESIEVLERRYSGSQALENEVDTIIKSAKSRIKKLEQEGESLEKNFLNYLERQKDKKQSIETDRIRIWQDYQLERRALHARPIGMPRTSTPLDVDGTMPVVDKNGLNYDEMAAELNNGDEMKSHKTRNINLVNPFKTFDTAIYLQKAHERRLLEGPKLERLEAYRRLDREVENIRRKVFIDNGFKPGANNMYLNPRGGSIFGANRYLNTNLEEKEIQTDPKEVKWHDILENNELEGGQIAQKTKIPSISIQKSPSEVPSEPKTKPSSSEFNPQSDRSSPLKSDLDLGEVTLDIELSKTSKTHSSGSTNSSKPIPDIGRTTKSPQEKGVNDCKEKELNWRPTDETMYKSLLIPSNEKTQIEPEIYDETLQTTIKEMTLKYFDDESSEQKSSTTFETEIDRMNKKTSELKAELDKDLNDLLSEKPSDNPQFMEKLDKLLAPSSTTSETAQEPLVISSSEDENFKISTGKPSSGSETSEDFWK